MDTSYTSCYPCTSQESSSWFPPILPRTFPDSEREIVECSNSKTRTHLIAILKNLRATKPQGFQPMDALPVLLICCKYRMMITLSRESDCALLTRFFCVSLSPNCPQSLALPITKAILDCPTFIKETDQLVKLLLAYKIIKLTVPKTKKNIP